MDRIIPVGVVFIVDTLDGFGQLVIPEFSFQISLGQMYHLGEHILKSKEETKSLHTTHAITGV